MLGRIWRFLKRNKGKIFLISVFAGGTVVAVNYMREKYKEYQDLEAAAVCERARKYHHFEGVQRSCNITVLSLVPKLESEIDKHFPVDSILAQLQNGPVDKLAKWQQLKIVSIARTFSTLYSCCILVVLLRVQFNILGGHVYPINIYLKTSLNGEVTSDYEICSRYLEITMQFLDKDIASLCQCIHQAVAQVMDMPLTEKYTIEKIASDFQKIKSEIDKSLNTTSGYRAIVSNLLRSVDLVLEDITCGRENISTFANSVDSETFHKVMKSTRVTLTSTYFDDIMEQCIIKGLSKVEEYITETYTNQHPNTSDIQLSDLTVPLAKLIPVIAKVHTRMTNSEHNTFMPQLMILPCLQDFGARVYDAASYRHTTS